MLAHFTKLTEALLCVCVCVCVTEVFGFTFVRCVALYISIQCIGILTIHNTVDHGEVQYHISSGGNRYIYTDSKQFGLDLHSSSSNDIKMAAHKLKKAVEAATKLSHPGDDRLSQLSGVFFYSGSLDNNLLATINELCIYKDTVSSWLMHWVYILLLNNIHCLATLKQ